MDRSTDEVRAGQKRVVILCHPDLKSFNAEVAQTYCNAVHAQCYEAAIRDLYGMNVNPVLLSKERRSSRAHLYRSDIIKNMSDLTVRRELYLVTEFADATCARLLHEKPALQAATL